MPPSAVTSAAPPVYGRRIVGMRTETLTRGPPARRRHGTLRTGGDRDGGGRHGHDGVQGLEPVAGVEDRPSRRPGRAARRPAACCSVATVTPPAVSAKMPSVSASSWMPATISSSETSAMAPPVRRATSMAYGPSAGLPIASDLAMVSGRTGWTTSWPAANAALTGEQPVACAPKIGRRGVLDQPERRRARGTPCRPWSSASRTRSARPADAAAASRAARPPRSRPSWSPRRSTGAG